MRYSLANKLLEGSLNNFFVLSNLFVFRNSGFGKKKKKNKKIFIYADIISISGGEKFQMIKLDLTENIAGNFNSALPHKKY